MPTFIIRDNNPRDQLEDYISRPTCAKTPPTLRAAEIMTHYRPQDMLSCSARGDEPDLYTPLLLDIFDRLVLRFPTFARTG